MTIENLPDVIWASRRPQDVGDRWTGPYKCYDDQTKYFRAEPVEELLKQARRVISESQARFANNEIAEPWGVGETIATIDQFLGGTK